MHRRAWGNCPLLHDQGAYVPDPVGALWGQLAFQGSQGPGGFAAHLGRDQQEQGCESAMHLGPLDHPDTSPVHRLEHVIEPVAVGRVRVVKRADVQGGFASLLRLMAPKMRRETARSLAALERQLSC